METKAIELLRAVGTANEQYNLRFRVYANNLTNLVNNEFIASYADGTGPYLDEYNFVYAGGVSTWSLRLDVVNPGVGADRFFWSDQTGVIRFSTSGAATATSQPIDG